jgi:hypothetical protein
MVSLTFGTVLPVQAQTASPQPIVPLTVVPAQVSAVANPDSATALAAPVVDSAQRSTVEYRSPDRRVAAHYAVTSEAAAPALLVQRRRAGLGQPMAMMVVGGAAVLLGAIIGDTPGTIIMIGGAVIGLIGLYEYLQ